jgi:hypothetical protein
VLLRVAVRCHANKEQIIITELYKLRDEANRHSSAVITLRAPSLTPPVAPGFVVLILMYVFWHTERKV